jgi:hypothetical protein
MNGLPAIANNLAAKGRYGDSMLVHMSPDEVRGLQALAISKGDSLTINPHTGLPEAFKLKDILAPIAGAALMMVPGMQPWAAGLMVGGFEALRTGDIGRGLTAGLGAWGGAGLGSAAGIGGGAAKSIGSATVSELPSLAAQSAGDSLMASSIGGMPTNIGNIAAQQAVDAGINIAAAPSVPGIAAGTAGPPSFLDRYVTSMGSPTKAIMGGMGVASPVLASMQPTYDFPTTPEGTSNYAGPYYPTARDVVYPDEERRRSSREFSYFSPSNPVPGFAPFRAAQGGLVALAKGGEFLDDGSFVIDARTVAEIGNGSSNAGKEILAQIGGRSVEGPGDGVSDSVPAMIEGGQEARVARDEVIFDADTVREIGDGSIKRGAQKLYALMDQAHKARKQAGRGEDTGTGLAALATAGAV